MTTNDLLQALARLRVDTGSLACLGCGHEVMQPRRKVEKMIRRIEPKEETT